MLFVKSFLLIVVGFFLSYKSYAEPLKDRNHQKLAVEHKFTATEESDLPPDPGAEGRLTLLGIDRDNDGVRDDIQRYIYFNYSSDLNVQAALTQLAKQYQVNLVVANDRLAVYHEAVKFNRRMECLFFVAGRNAIDLSAQLKAEVLNTSLRTQKHLRFNKNLGGQIIISKPISEWPNSCNFQIK